MRSSFPILLLLAAVAVGLGLRAFWHGGAERIGPAAEHGAAATPAARQADAAHGGSGPGATEVPQGHVLTGISEEPDDVNPLTQHSLIAARILSYTHDTLLDSDPATGALRPALAVSYVPAADGGSCTFTLREGVQFADGSPMTMADVLFAWRYAQIEGAELGAAALAFDRVAAVDVVDERRFCVHFRDRHYAAVQIVGESWPVVCRQWFVDRVAELARHAGMAPPAEDSAEFAALVARIGDECGPGTGPYVLQNRPGGPSTWRRGEELTLVRNDRSWRRRERPGTWNFAGIRFRFLDTAAAFNALLRGELDWYTAPGVDQLLRSRPELETSFRRVDYDYRQLGVLRVIWNCARPPFDDPRVRRALTMLFDVERIVDVFGGHCPPARAFAKPDSAAYPAVEPLPFDVGAARAALRELGYGPELDRPLQLSLLAPEGPEPMRRTLDLFADAARRAGIDLDLRVREWTQFVAEKTREQWGGLLVLQGFRSWGDPYDFVHSDGTDNDGHWSDAEADRLAAAARTELDAARRDELWRQLHERVYREQPTTFLLHLRVQLLLSRHVEAAEPGPLGLSLERAHVAPEHQRR